MHLKTGKGFLNLGFAFVLRVLCSGGKFLTDGVCSLKVARTFEYWDLQESALQLPIV